MAPITYQVKQELPPMTSIFLINTAKTTMKCVNYSRNSLVFFRIEIKYINQSMGLAKFGDAANGFHRFLVGGLCIGLMRQMSFTQARCLSESIGLSPKPGIDQ